MKKHRDSLRQQKDCAVFLTRIAFIERQKRSLFSCFSLIQDSQSSFFVVNHLSIYFGLNMAYLSICERWMIISTRRFSERPAAVSLLAFRLRISIGLDSSILFGDNLLVD